MEILKRGIPSKDTLSRVFAALDYSQLNSCFVEWAQSISQHSKGEVIAIDEKRIRSSYDKSSNKNAIHMVTVFPCANGFSLGQVATDEKSNEITAIPKLLDLLTIADCTVTLDAMGCQKDIAQKIVDKKADYILAIKENQSELLNQTRKLFSIAPKAEHYEEVDAGHGRIETRRSTVINDLKFLDGQEEWPALNCIGF